MNATLGSVANQARELGVWPANGSAETGALTFFALSLCLSLRLIAPFPPQVSCIHRRRPRPLAWQVVGIVSRGVV